MKNCSITQIRPQLRDASTALRIIRHAYHAVRAKAAGFPRSKEALLASDLYNSWWYYGVELIPGVVKKGFYDDRLPFLPRIVLGHCDLQNADCLDIGSMEGLIPVLMCRKGARRVLATDAAMHCYRKLMAIQHYHNVRFGFRQVGLMYDLYEKLKGYGGFDLINLSGVLYHVFSPMHTIAGLRGLLKKNGIMIVSTNIVNMSGHCMAFNKSGELQSEANTFWYMTVSLLEYMLRYFRLLPIDCLYSPHTKDDPVRYTPKAETGYLTVVCRAGDETASLKDDPWGRDSMRVSWESIGLCDHKAEARQPSAKIGYNKPLATNFLASDGQSIDLVQMVQSIEPRHHAATLSESHTLLLDDIHLPCDYRRGKRIKSICD